MVRERNMKQVNPEQMSLMTTRNATTPSVQQVEPEGMWFPRAKLLQGLSPEVNNGDGRPGQWHIEGHGAVPSLVMVPLGERMSRRLTEGEGDEMLTLCFSDDGLEGKGDPGGYCPSCLMAEWRGGGE